MTTTTKTLRCECSSCAGTGLYSGFMEDPGQAVICITCGGTGCREIHYKDFTRRKRRRGIQQIRAGSGLILDNPSKASWISYAEFEAAIPQKKGE